MSEVLAAEGSIGEPAINISIFGVFVLITLVITFRASRSNKSAADYYAAGRNISGQQNGLAIAGDYLSAASFLGIAGAIAVYGYDGFLYSIASWSPGWSHYYLSPNYCATQANSRWPTC